MSKGHCMGYVHKWLISNVYGNWSPFTVLIFEITRCCDSMLCERRNDFIWNLSPITFMGFFDFITFILSSHWAWTSVVWIKKSISTYSTWQLLCHQLYGNHVDSYFEMVFCKWAKQENMYHYNSGKKRTQEEGRAMKSIHWFHHCKQCLSRIDEIVLVRTTHIVGAYKGQKKYGGMMNKILWLVALRRWWRVLIILYRYDFSCILGIWISIIFRSRVSPAKCRRRWYAKTMRMSGNANFDLSDWAVMISWSKRPLKRLISIKWNCDMTWNRGRGIEYSFHVLLCSSAVFLLLYRHWQSCASLWNRETATIYAVAARKAKRKRKHSVLNFMGIVFDSSKGCVHCVWALDTQRIVFLCDRRLLKKIEQRHHKTIGVAWEQNRIRFIQSMAVVVIRVFFTIIS